MDDEYFLSHFNTPLTAEDEEAYNKWLVDLGNSQGRNVAHDHYNYDLRGFWKENPNIVMGPGQHFTDKYKKPNHPTFSTESIYHNISNPVGGKFVGGVWGKDPWGGDTYTPSKEMLQTTHRGNFLPDYFQRYEKKAQLLMP